MNIKFWEVIDIRKGLSFFGNMSIFSFVSQVLVKIGIKLSCIYFKIICMCVQLKRLLFMFENKVEIIIKIKNINY